LFVVLRKEIRNAIKGSKMLLNIFLWPTCICRYGCVEYDCMELKDNHDVRNIFFIFWEFCSERPIELYETFDRSLKEIFTLVHKPRKLRSTEEILALLCETIAITSSKEDKSM